MVFVGRACLRACAWLKAAVGREGGREGGRFFVEFDAARVRCVPATGATQATAYVSTGRVGREYISLYISICILYILYIYIWNYIYTVWYLLYIYVFLFFLLLGAPPLLLRHGGRERRRA